MPHRSWAIRIEDILDAIDAVHGFLEGFDLEAFRRDRRTRDAVLHNLEVIGEAARNVPSDVRVQHPEVPWQDMADMRNVLAHEYFGVDVEIVWRTVTKDLPTLPPLLRPLLQEPEK